VITEIHLENFKRFRDLSLTCKALTVLTGANGAGKTSILHALLLARQISRQPTRSHVELSGVDTLELGGAEDVINRYSSDENAAVEVRDSHGRSFRWAFRADGSDDIRTLNAEIVAKPVGQLRVLSESAPRFCYLCAERLGPRDVLSASASANDELDVGSRGEFVAQVLASFARSRVSEGRFACLRGGKQLSGLLHQTESWMAKIVSPIQIDAEWFPNTSVTRLRFKSPGLRTEWTRAPNAGFGISYALPIVVAALRAEVDGLLLIENPEAHLHPAGQSKIGSFLAQVAADGVQIFLETHSDHVLNGIRVATADRKKASSSEQTIVHFFHAEDDESKMFESMELSGTGQLTAWPKGFFDQAQVDLANLASARRVKG